MKTLKVFTCHPEIENPACLRPGLMGQDTRGAISDEAKFNLDTVLPAIVTFGNSSKQGNKPSSNRISAPIADNRSGALTRAERQTGLAPSVASEQSGKLHTVAPKGQRLRGERKGQQTQSIISGSKLASSEGQTCRSLKTRADNDSVCIAGSPEDYYIDRSCGRANYTLFVSPYAKEN